MKSTKIVKISVVIISLLICISFKSFTPINIVKYKPDKSSPQPIRIYNELRCSSSWNLSNIYINNNWSDTANDYDWCDYKDGYYIIENISITGVSGKNGIHIENTTENFIIRNCQISEGVQLLRTKGGNLINNRIYFGYSFYVGIGESIGISITNCSNIILRNNHLNDTIDDYYYKLHGFLIHESSNITIEENFLSVNSHTYISDSYGISVQETQGCKNIDLINNTIFRFDIGMKFNSDISNCSSIDNQIYNSRIGLVASGTNHVFSNNIIKNCTQWGLYLGGSNNNVSFNTIDESEMGMRIGNANYNVIDSNSIQDMSEYGMHLEDCNYNNITNNNIRKAGEIGIYLNTCNHTIITGNYISHNLRCILEIDCFGNIISDNKCIDLQRIIWGYYPYLMIGIVIISVSRLKFKSKKIK